jgi:hypothetical protein
MFRLFNYDMGPLGSVLLILIALGGMWLGYMFSRPSNYQLSIRRPPPDDALPMPKKKP